MVFTGFVLLACAYVRASERPPTPILASPIFFLSTSAASPRSHTQGLVITSTWNHSRRSHPPVASTDDLLVPTALSASGPSISLLSPLVSSYCPPWPALILTVYDHPACTPSPPTSPSLHHTCAANPQVSSGCSILLVGKHRATLTSLVNFLDTNRLTATLYFQSIHSPLPVQLCSACLLFKRAPPSLSPFLWESLGPCFRK